MVEWSNIIWSDECLVEKGSRKQRTWVFRFFEEKWTKKMIQPFPKRKGVNVMVWACFHGEGRSDFYKLARDFEVKKMGYSAALYIEVLEDNLLGIWESGFVFMQDNVFIHKVKKVTKWLKDHGEVIIDWPFYNFDLNFIEHVWYDLKKLVYEVNPNIDSVSGFDDIVKEAF